MRVLIRLTAAISLMLLQPFAPFDLEKWSFSVAKLAIRADDSSLLHCFGFSLVDYKSID